MLIWENPQLVERSMQEIYAVRSIQEINPVERILSLGAWESRSRQTALRSSRTISENLPESHSRNGGEEGDAEGCDRVLPLSHRKGGDHSGTQASNGELGESGGAAFQVRWCGRGRNYRQIGGWIGRGRGFVTCRWCSLPCVITSVIIHSIARARQARPWRTKSGRTRSGLAEGRASRRRASWPRDFCNSSLIWA